MKEILFGRQRSSFYDGHGLHQGTKTAKGTKGGAEKISDGERQIPCRNAVDACGNFTDSKNHIPGGGRDDGNLLQKGAENTEKNQITAQYGDSFKPVHDSGI